MTQYDVSLMTTEIAEGIITRAHNQWENEKMFLKAECEFWRMKYQRAVEKEREACVDMVEDESLIFKEASQARHILRQMAAKLRARGEKV